MSNVAVPAAFFEKGHKSTKQNKDHECYLPQQRPRRRLILSS